MKKPPKRKSWSAAAVQRRRTEMSRLIEMVRQELAARLRREREARGWSRVRLEASAGMSRQMVARIKTGTRRPTFETLLQLVLALRLARDRLTKYLMNKVRAFCAAA